MIIIRAIKKLFQDPLLFVDSCLIRLNAFLSDKLYLSLRYRCQIGNWINWDNPQTFTEKIQWLKVYDFKPEYTNLVDKFSVKDYVANKIGSQYVIPTLGVWDKVEDVNWDSLPNQFALKVTDDGGSNGVIICKDKTQLDIEQTKCHLSQMMSRARIKPGKDVHREHPYERIPRRIIAEQFISEGDGSSDLSDYKFFCFNGEPKYCQVIRDRHTNETIDFYDMNWNHMPFIGLVGKNTKIANGLTPVVKPECLDKMIQIARKLSSDKKFCRVDLYSIGKQVYFGEITFYPASGMGWFVPVEWNLKLGELIRL